MAKAKISSKDFLDLLDEQRDQPAVLLGSFGRQPAAEKPPSNGSLNSSPNGKQTVANGSLNSSPNGKQTVANPSPSVFGKNTKRESNGSPNGSHDNVRNGSQTVVQTVVKNTPSSESPLDKIMRLGAIESRILFCVIESCIARGQLVSNPLKPDFLAKAAGTTKKTTKSCAQRLVKKELLARAGGQDGKGGWTIFRVSEATRNAVLEIWKINPNGSQTVVQTVVTADRVTVVKQESKQESAAPSSSSFLDSETLKTTTTSDPELFNDARIQHSPDWLSVDTSSLADIGFTQTHLMQLARHGKLSASEVNTSIEFFAFDLRRNGKAKALNGSPLNFFMGILRKGIPYAPPENFETAADEARRRTCEILERKERERQAGEQRIMDLEFAEWRRGVAAAELARLLPDWAQKPGHIQDSAIRTYFDDKVWPTLEATRAGVLEAERAEIRTAVEESLGEVRS